MSAGELLIRECTKQTYILKHQLVYRHLGFSNKVLLQDFLDEKTDWTLLGNRLQHAEESDQSRDIEPSL